LRTNNNVKIKCQQFVTQIYSMDLPESFTTAVRF